jgi:hypothetical protein
MILVNRRINRGLVFGVIFEEITKNGAQYIMQ